MTHFNGSTSGVKIHTTKGGTCGKGSGCDYRTNTPPLPNAGTSWDAHHILCFQSVNAYGGLDDFIAVVDEINDSYKLTDWCLNQAPNMIALPLKKTYREIAACRSLNLPCHDRDHRCTDGYLAEVTKAFIADIWNPIRDQVANAAKNNTHFTPSDVLGEIQNLEADFRRKLESRGSRPPGTQVGFSLQGSLTNYWWLPFSMAKTVVAMQRPLLCL